MDFKQIFDTVLPYLPYAIVFISAFVAALFIRTGTGVKIKLPKSLKEFKAFLTDERVIKAITLAIGMAEEQKGMDGAAKKKYAMTYVKKWAISNAVEYTGVPEFIVSIAVEKIFAELGGLK